MEKSFCYFYPGGFRTQERKWKFISSLTRDISWWRGRRGKREEKAEFFDLHSTGSTLMSDKNTTEKTCVNPSQRGRKKFWPKWVYWFFFPFPNFQFFGKEKNTTNDSIVEKRMNRKFAKHKFWWGKDDWRQMKNVSIFFMGKKLDKCQDQREVEYGEVKIFYSLSEKMNWNQPKDTWKWKTHLKLKNTRKCVVDWFWK